MKEQKTAEQVLRETYHEYGIEYKPSHILSDSVAPIAMQSYSDQQNAELRDQLKETENILDASTYNLKRVVKKCNTLTERVKELEAWKESASTVLNELDLQSLGQKLGIKLGESISKQLPGKVDELNAQNDRYRKALEDVIIRLEEDKRFNALSIAKEALKQEVNND